MAASIIFDRNIRKDESGSSWSSLPFRLTSHSTSATRLLRTSRSDRYRLVCGPLHGSHRFFSRTSRTRPIPANSFATPFIFASSNLFHSMRYQTTIIRAMEYRLAKNDVLQRARVLISRFSTSCLKEKERKLHRKIPRFFCKNLWNAEVAEETSV